MFNCELSYKNNGWHGMYVMSGINQINDRIYKVDNSMELFMKHTIATAKQKGYWV